MEVALITKEGQEDLRSVDTDSLEGLSINKEDVLRLCDSSSINEKLSSILIHNGNTLKAGRD